MDLFPLFFNGPNLILKIELILKSTLLQNHNFIFRTPKKVRRRGSPCAAIFSAISILHNISIISYITLRIFDNEYISIITLFDRYYISKFYKLSYQFINSNHAKTIIQKKIL